MSRYVENPFSVVYDELWGILEGIPGLDEMVPKKNRIKLDGRSSAPRKHEAAAADYPELMLVQDVVEANIRGTNQTSEVEAIYGWIHAVNDVSMMQNLMTIQWLILVGMHDWVSRLRQLTFRGKTFVYEANIASGSEIEDRLEQRGLVGWTASWAVTVKMNFEIGDMADYVS